jgi:hypothetical protein
LTRGLAVSYEGKQRQLWEGEIGLTVTEAF